MESEAAPLIGCFFCFFCCFSIFALSFGVNSIVTGSKRSFRREKAYLNGTDGQTIQRWDKKNADVYYIPSSATQLITTDLNSCKGSCETTENCKYIGFDDAEGSCMMSSSLKFGKNSYNYEIYFNNWVTLGDFKEAQQMTVDGWFWFLAPGAFIGSCGFGLSCCYFLYVMTTATPEFPGYVSCTCCTDPDWSNFIFQGSLITQFWWLCAINTVEFPALNCAWYMNDSCPALKHWYYMQVAHVCYSAVVNNSFTYLVQCFEDPQIVYGIYVVTHWLIGLATLLFSINAFDCIYNDSDTEHFRTAVGWCEVHAKVAFPFGVLYVGFEIVFFVFFGIGVILQLCNRQRNTCRRSYKKWRKQKKDAKEQARNEIFCEDLELYWKGQRDIVIYYLDDIDQLWDIVWDFSWGLEKQMINLYPKVTADKYSKAYRTMEQFSDIEALLHQKREIYDPRLTIIYFYEFENIGEEVYDVAKTIGSPNFEKHFDDMGMGQKRTINPNYRSLSNMVRTYSTRNIFSSTKFLPRGVSFAGNESIGLDTIDHDPEDSQRSALLPTEWVKDENGDWIKVTEAKEEEERAERHRSLPGVHV